MSFEIGLASLQRNIALEVKLGGSEFGARPERTQHLCDVMRTNTKTTTLDLADSGLGDTPLQQMVAVLVTGGMPALVRLDLRRNPALSPVADTLLHGLRRLRPAIQVVLSGADGGEAALSEATDTFACSRELIEGLSAWPLHELVIREGSNDLRCPICKVATLKAGRVTSGGNQHRCENDDGCGSYFLASIGIGDLTLIGNRRRPPGQ
jgi:hypothetical protein